MVSIQSTNKMTSILLLVLSALTALQGSMALHRRNNSLDGRLLKVVNLENGGLPNQVHMSVINQKYKEYLTEQDNFLSATVGFTLSPMKDYMDRSQIITFEKGLTSFLKTDLFHQFGHQLNVLAVIVTNSKGTSLLNESENTPAIINHT